MYNHGTYLNIMRACIQESEICSVLKKTMLFVRPMPRRWWDTVALRGIGWYTYPVSSVERLGL